MPRGTWPVKIALALRYGGAVFWLGFLAVLGVLAWAYLKYGTDEPTRRPPRRSKLSEGNNFARDDTFRAALKYGREVEVAGESHANADGVQRRDIIATLKVGDMVQLEREIANQFDPNAILINTFQGVIGYVCAADAAEIAPWMDRGERVAAYVTSIAGGPAKGHENYGVWLRAISIEQLPQWIEDAKP